MEKEREFLNFIYKNADMGVIGINDVLKVIENDKFEKLLCKQKEEYEHICKETAKLLLDIGEVHEENSGIAKVRSGLLVKIETLKDKSLSVITKMLIEGTNKGIIEIQEKINNLKVDNDKIMELANKLLEIEENNIEVLKKYL